jgi:hypothetical protein
MGGDFFMADQFEEYFQASGRSQLPVPCLIRLFRRAERRKPPNQLSHGFILPPDFSMFHQHSGGGWKARKRESEKAEKRRGM